MLRGLIITLITIVISGSVQGQDLASLRPWIPEDINAVAVVRAAEILKSPRAVGEGWQHAGSENFLGGAFTLPPDCDLFLRATRFRPGPGDDWSVALLTFSRPVDMKRVAEQEQSSIQLVASKPAVLSRRNCFFAELGPQLLGVVSPAHRQDLARWIERGQRKHDATLNRYLDEVLLGQSAAITLAIDLTEMFDPGRLKARLPSMGAMIGKQQDVDVVIGRIMAVRGLRLDIYFDEQSTAALTVDFASPVGSDAPLMKSILLEALGDLGVGLDSFQASEPKADASSIRLAARFTDEDLRRVMTLVLTPHPAQPSDSLPTPPPAPAAGAVTVKTPASTTARPAPRVSGDNNVKYFKAVDQVLKDLTRANHNAKDYARTATWHDNFANKIDQLSTLAVDPDLVAYGTSVSSKLRSIAASLRGVGIEINTLNNAVVYNTRVNPGWEQVGWWTYGYQPATWEVTSNLAQVREQQAAAVAAGAKDREAVWTMINNERAQIMETMARKYGEAFTSAVGGK
jgi:hypothetical protein